MAGYVLLLFSLLGVVAANPAPSPVLLKLDETRYQFTEGAGQTQLVDVWITAADLKSAARYNPDVQNVYHLFTRENPSVSQPVLLDREDLLSQSSYNPARRTIILLHGWLDNASTDFNTVVVPAFLEAEDVNVIVVDWELGANLVNYATAVLNTVTSGESVARFINWLNLVTGATLGNYHIVGHGLGGHQAGIIGRNVGRQVAYITALDPANPGWRTNGNKFSCDDGVYTEVIHTNAGLLVYLANLGDSDFYPNGGIDMPGCSSQECDHARSFYYFAESLTSGGFTGQRCSTYVTAMAGSCYLWGNLQMGGLVPKTGNTGIYYLRTRAFPPFSRS